MSRGIFLEQDGKLLKMTEQPYDSERVLQQLLATYPSLLVGDQINPRAPREWLLVCREAGIPDSMDGNDKWSIDHIFLDQEGIPTLVEVKRSTDTRIRREVVGQLLDYAANLLEHWPPERLRREFELRCEREGKDAGDEIANLIGEESDPDEYWQSVADNLQLRRIRLVFVADEIPQRLRTIVEFLNDQMKSSSVLAVEVRQYVSDDGIKALVPTLIGAEKGPGPGPDDRYLAFWRQFLAVLRSRHPELAHVEASASRALRFDSGRNDCRYSLVFGKGRRIRAVFSCSWDLFDRLVGKRDEIERVFGGPLVWKKNPKSSRIRLDLHDAEIANEEAWPLYQEWMVDVLPRLRSSIQPFLEKFPSNSQG